MPNNRAFKRRGALHWRDRTAADSQFIDGTGFAVIGPVDPRVRPRPITLKALEIL